VPHQSPPHIVSCHLAVLAGDGDDAAAVEPLDVWSADGEVDRAHLDSCHELGLFDRRLDGFHRRIEIHDDAALQPLDSATPSPTTSIPPVSSSSPTTVQTFDVPMSSPTT
jgi:hypothetical protein